jgi:predicted transcriptional regulator
MTNGIIEAVDFRMQAMAREADHGKDSSIQMTIRMPESLKIKLDVISNFMGGTRNSILVEFLEIACREAIERIETNPYMSGLTVNGRSISEALADASKGELADLDDALHELDVAPTNKPGKKTR